ncbi:MAG: NAD(P)H-dependent oxidoreductase [Desulfobacteraceae bacterium]|nr:NAD(P)H-dependent oxidoreductase [Desulfobacteraceae bacterium]MCF8095643.1 NAD(P)H-dependent oxidoreductase [Desulfobacteraceae bacterium]
MYVLGLQGSPRLKGNTNFLLDMFLDELAGRGAVTEKVHAARIKAEPCIGCGYCEEKGVCVFADDDMSLRIYNLLRRADAVVLASPVYFYTFPARIKAIIDRSQALWSRKYRFGIEDPGRPWRRGFLLSLGATKGKNLFDGMGLTARYFFDAVGAGFADTLTYRRIEQYGDLEKHPGVSEDVKASAKHLEQSFSRKKILFACRENSCRSQMAAGFAKYLAGDRIEALNAGSTPARYVNAAMQEVMAEKGIDMVFRSPRSIEDAVSETKPDMIITMGCGEQCPYIPGVSYIDWDLPDPAGQDIDLMRKVRDEIETRVRRLIEDQV